jgi:hypothetical protein
MALQDHLMVSTDPVFPTTASKTGSKRTLFQRMSKGRSLINIWPRIKPRIKPRSGHRSAKNLTKNLTPQSEKHTADVSMDPTSIEELSPTAIPVEVTVLDNFPEGHSLDQTYDVIHQDKRLEVAQAESKEYLAQLHKTQWLVDQQTRDLNRSRGQVAELINHNMTLLEELKAVAGKDDATLEEPQMLRQELIAIKGSLFLGTLFVLCGGRADMLPLIGLIWMVVDVST